LKYYASPRQNYGVGTFHISKDIKIKNVEVCTKGFSRLIVINLYFPYSMHPQLEEVHGLVRKSAKDFVERRVEPNARRIDQGWYPRELLRKMGELGLLAPHVPPEYGGAGLDFWSMVIVPQVFMQTPSL
jgi:alkylation response protein AidB-like acyl-CoA dehydrogenase